MSASPADTNVRGVWRWQPLGHATDRSSLPSTFVVLTTQASAQVQPASQGSDAYRIRYGYYENNALRASPVARAAAGGRRRHHDSADRGRHHCAAHRRWHDAAAGDR